MALKNYLKSSRFLIDIGLSVAIVFVFGFLAMNWLTFTTGHGEEIIVPDLSKLSKEEVEEKLDRLSLNYIVLDSVDFQKDFPAHSVVEQDPAPNSAVKKGRKIYLKFNASGFSFITLPNLINKTYREVIPAIKTLGLIEGTTTYIPSLSKDIVLELRCKGINIKPGERILKSSVIDLVLGNGKLSYEEDESQKNDLENQ